MHDRHHGTSRLARAGGPGDEKVAARLVAGPFESPQAEDDGRLGLKPGNQRVINQPRSDAFGHRSSRHYEKSSPLTVAPVVTLPSRRHSKRRLRALAATPAF